MLFNDEFYIIIYDNVIEGQISCSVQLRLCIKLRRLRLGMLDVRLVWLRRQCTSAEVRVGER
jgi:hypothetical protein